MSAIEWTDRVTDRFWTYVDKSGDCWNWTGGTFGGRYGQFRAGRRKVKAHRFAWETANGPIPEGQILCHRCDNMRCVRPDHLFLGTHADNAADRDAKGRGRTYRGPRPDQRGSANPSAKLTDQNVSAIRDLRASGWTYRALAQAFDVSSSQIANVCKGRSWRTA